MRIRFKNIAGLATVGLLAMTGCSDNGGEADGDTLSVAAFSAGYATPGGKLTLDRFVELGEEKGWDVTLYTSDFDYDTINSDLQSAITQDVDVIMAGFPDPRQIAPMVNAAEAADIPIFSIDGGVEPNDDFVLDVTFDQQQLAELTVSALEDAMGGLEGKDVMVVGHDPHIGIMTRSNLAYDMLEEAGANIAGGEMKQALNPGTSQEEALQFVTDFLEANPDGLDGVWAGWDHAALGAAQAVSEAGRDDIFVTGVDALGVAVEQIEKNGPFYGSVHQDWFSVVDEVIGEIENYDETGDLPEENFVEVEGELIDRSNVEDFTPSM